MSLSISGEMWNISSPHLKKYLHHGSQGLWFGRKIRKRSGKRTGSQAEPQEKSTLKININLTSHSKISGKVLANCKHLTEEYV